MSLDSDLIVDRRRIRRKLTFWRVLAVVIAIAAIAVIGMLLSPSGRGTFSSSGSIARVNIDGEERPITMTITWDLKADGDKLTGTMRRSAPEMDLPSAPAPVKGSRVK